MDPSFHDFPGSGFFGVSSYLTTRIRAGFSLSFPCSHFDATECQRHILDLPLTPELKNMSTEYSEYRPTGIFRTNLHDFTTDYSKNRIDDGDAPNKVSTLLWIFACNIFPAGVKISTIWSAATCIFVALLTSIFFFILFHAFRRGHAVPHYLEIRPDKVLPTNRAEQGKFSTEKVER